MKAPLPVVVISLLLIGIGFTQTTTSLRGTVSDSQSAVIPQAIVTLTNAETGSTRQTLTDAVGEYQFVQIAPGLYKITAEKPGFSTASQTGVKLLVNTPATLDLRLEVGTTTELV